MARTKKTTTEEPKTTTIVETEESVAVDGICIDDKGRAWMESAPDMEEGEHYAANWDYKIVPVNDVIKYLYNGYTLHGGPFVRFNEVYQCVILYGTEVVSDAEFEARKEKYKL